jgi:hypothetical protein
MRLIFHPPRRRRPRRTGDPAAVAMGLIVPGGEGAGLHTATATAKLFGMTMDPPTQTAHPTFGLGLMDSAGRPLPTPTPTAWPEPEAEPCGQDGANDAATGRVSGPPSSVLSTESCACGQSDHPSGTVHLAPLL